MNKHFGKRILAVSLALTLAFGGAAAVSAKSVTSNASNGVYSSTTGGENAVLVSGKTVTLTSPTVTKSGDSSGDNADFTGTNAAVLATDKASLTITGGTVTTNGAHANGVFSYGSGTTVNISGTKITTSGNNSGGIMTTGGATTNASDLTISTSGNSSAAIRSDRGGGDVNVNGGTYKTSGVGSPAIYSTADIDVTGAKLTSTTSEAVVIEGGNSVSLTDCTVTADNTKANGQSTNLQNVMIYQSMSGDASEGASDFTMKGGTMTAESGDMFYVTNTTCTIHLSGVTFNYADGDLLCAQADAWGTSGSNGGNVTLYAESQALSGKITIDRYSTLNLIMSGTSAYKGAIAGTGSVYVEVPSGCTWTLTGNSTVSALTCAASSINLNGYTLTVNGTAYTAGTASTGAKVSGSSSSSGSQSASNGQSDSGSQSGSGSQSAPGSQSGSGSQSAPGNSSANAGAASGTSSAGTTKTTKAAKAAQKLRATLEKYIRKAMALNLLTKPDANGQAPSGTASTGTATGSTTGGTAPSETAPSGTAPSGTAPTGTVPSGTAPSGTAPSGTTPTGAAPSASSTGNPLKVGDVIKIAAILHDLYKGGKLSDFDLTSSDYTQYVTYAVAKKLIKANVYQDMTASISVKKAVKILKAAVPVKKLSKIKTTTTAAKTAVS